MEVDNGNLVTAPGDSDPQVPAVVGGSGVTARSNVVGPLRSSSNDHEGTGVASLAPATQKTTRAETDVSTVDTPYDLVKVLGGKIQTHNGGLSLLNTKAQALEMTVDKLRSDTAKTAISELLAVIKALRSSKDEVTRAYNAAIAAVKSAAQNPAPNPPHVQTSGARTQTPCWWDLGGPTPQQMEPREGPRDKLVGLGNMVDQLGAEEPVTSGWTEVVKRKAKVAVQKPVEPKERKKHLKMRPAAIVVDIANHEDFPGLVKKIRSGANAEVIGERVVGMRKTRAGRLLLEVKGNSRDVEAVRAEIHKSTGSGSVVRTLEPRTMLEVRDLDEWSSKDEVVEAVAAATGASRENSSVIGLKKGYRGSQTAFVLVPTALCGNVVKHGRIRVGLVNCRVRQGEQKTRCFRCLAFGHMASQCKGPDRGKCCRRCGGIGHKAATCEASAGAAKEFAQRLAGKGLEEKSSGQWAASNDGKAAAEATDGAAKEFAIHLKNGEKGGDLRLPTVGSSDPDRTMCCRRCGRDGHKAANCNAMEQAASAFAGGPSLSSRTQVANAKQ